MTRWKHRSQKEVKRFAEVPLVAFRFGSVPQSRRRKRWESRLGHQRLQADAAPDARLIRCQHLNGDITILKEPSINDRLPQVLLSTRQC